MNTQEFSSIYEAQLNHEQKILIDRAQCYVRNDDRLHNFKRAAKMHDTSPEYALMGMLAKHTISLHDIIDDIEQERRSFDLEKASEYITDIRNYHMLLLALLTERDEKCQ